MTESGAGFLADLSPRPLGLAGSSELRPQALHIGKGALALEVAVLEARDAPSATRLQAAWKARLNKRAVPLLVVALHGHKAVFCGPSGEDPPVYAEIDAGQAERICRQALAQPDRNAALRFLASSLPSLATPLPGLRNEGLLALHTLDQGAPRRPDWGGAAERARQVQQLTGENLLRGLGFSIERNDGQTSILRAADRRTALAVLLERHEAPDAGSQRFAGLSPVSYALSVAERENLPWVIVVQADRLRLYATAPQQGVGRRGRTETFVELQTSLLRDEHLAYLWLLFSAEALGRDGPLEQLIAESHRFAGKLAERLRERIYERVMPRLAQAIATARRLANPTADDLALTYSMALTVLFRLLFVAYAEDSDLLPYKHSDAYRRRSLKEKAKELLRGAAAKQSPGDGDAHWRETVLLFDAVNEGNREWGVPPYDGGLFSSEAAVSPAGAALKRIALPDAAFEPVLADLLLIETQEGGLGPVDFRSLGVREFGTIYEGLLESELSVAETDLALKTEKERQVYVPAKARDRVAVRKGAIYLHDRSGARKSTGSYFTKGFAVEHLLDGALEPALDDHLKRLDALDEADAADAFFDFRVADIAMGSAHFLVAAVDRIERRLSQYLAKRSLPGVRRELATLRAAAVEALGQLAEQIDIEDGRLIRRLIARRCVYGVDLNPLSVQLARLAIWIHSFVPGLPLSVLDHNLVQGNSLVGVGTVEEIRRRFQAEAGDLIRVDADSLLGAAKEPLERLARIADATRKDIAAARQAIGEARQASEDTAALCDIVAGQPVADRPIHFQYSEWEKQRGTLGRSAARRAAAKALEGLSPIHFPIAFPEVFLRPNPGFDAILGNPPWQEATVEEHAFWARHFPGLRGLSQPEQGREKARLRRQRPDLIALYDAEVAEADRTRRLLTSGAFPGMGTGDPDLYKAFCWRFWHLVKAEGGRIGVVLPRSALSAKGSAEFRKSLFNGSEGISITTVLNRGGWVFDDAEHRYTIGLITLKRGAPAGESIRLRGPYASLAAFQAGVAKPAHAFRRETVESWTDTASLPLLPTEESLGVFLQLRKAPRLDRNDGRSWRARPDREMDATNQKDLMKISAERPEGFWPVYKGESFDLWQPDTGSYYAWAKPDKVMAWLWEKRLGSAKRKKESAHAEFPLDYLRRKDNLPCLRPRVAFRDVTNRTNQRTVIAALLPPEVFITNKGPYFLWPRGDEKDQAYLLGVLCSIPLDWYARRFVEVNVNFFIINPFPIPRPQRDDKRWQRVVALAGRLACPDRRFAGWARAVGVECGKLADDEKEDMIHELDAVVAHLYGLGEAQLHHIFATFHEGWDFRARLDATLRHFRSWARRP
jgi:hypothetical protein